MNKDIMDYLPFYLGCQVLISADAATFPNETGTLSLVDKSTNTVGVTVGGFDDYAEYRSNLIKPKLRRLSSMTRDESNTVLSLPLNSMDWNYPHFKNDEEDYVAHYTYNREQIVFLLSNFFDIFGLIKDGLAIEIKLQNA